MPARSADDVRIEAYGGPRESLRPLFELAEDSAAELDSYIDAGRVLVAVSGEEIIGHLQLTGTGDPRQLEIKNMAVRETLQGQGTGRRLVRAAVDLAAAEAVTTILVATAAADIGNLRFYQRQGFRMRSVERDAFTPATGYPPGLLIDGIELRDRVWLDRTVLVRVHVARTIWLVSPGTARQVMGEFPVFSARMGVCLQTCWSEGGWPSTRCVRPPTPRSGARAGSCCSRVRPAWARPRSRPRR
jgi:GNAT superfamily N-acetyltransferase